MQFIVSKGIVSMLKRGGYVKVEFCVLFLKWFYKFVKDKK